jgi:hypothetical protein
MKQEKFQQISACLRPCATKRKVARSIPDGAVNFSLTMSFRAIQHPAEISLTEMIVRNICSGIEAAGA